MQATSPRDWMPAPTTAIAALVVGASASMVSGVFVLWGHGWALIAFSGVLFLIAAALARGMNA